MQLGGAKKGLKYKVKNYIRDNNIFLMFITVPRLSYDLDESIRIIKNWRRRNKNEMEVIYGGIHKAGESFYHFHCLAHLKGRIEKEKLGRGLPSFIDIRRVYNVNGVLTYISNSIVELYDRDIF